MIRDFIKIVIQKIFCVFPTRNVIIFESGQDFSDSSKALYDEMLKQHIEKQFKIVWFVENVKKFSNIKGTKFYNVNPRNLKEYVIKYYYCAIAKYCFYTNQLLGFKSKKNQIRYYLTHSPLPIKNSKGFLIDYKSNTYIEVVSKFAAQYRCKTLGGGLDRIKILGLPRNDYLFIKDEKIPQKLNLNNYNKVFIWMPTFKHCEKNKKRNDLGVERQEDISMLNKKSLEKINQLLVENMSLLIVKFHPAQDMNFVKEFNLSNILFLTNKKLEEMQINLYSFLNYTDALITDFSSVYVDYLLLNKPIAFDLTDKDLYLEGIGFTMENPLEFMPGTIIYNLEDFLSFLNKVIKDKDDFYIERVKFRDKIHKYKDGKSSERILKELNLI